MTNVCLYYGFHAAKFNYTFHVLLKFCSLNVCIVDIQFEPEMLYVKFCCCQQPGTARWYEVCIFWRIFCMIIQKTPSLYTRGLYYVYDVYFRHFSACTLVPSMKSFIYLWVMTNGFTFVSYMYEQWDILYILRV